MKTTIEIINRAIGEHPDYCIAFSGGDDSLVLIDIVCGMGYRPALIHSDDQMEHCQTVPYIEATAAKYGLALHIAKADRTPLEQWQLQGWPMLGKLAARKFMQRHSDFGYKLDVSSCCRNLKIAPARKLMKKLGFTMQMTGQRGDIDDALRGLREIKDGALFYQKSDGLWICNPLLGWTDLMIARYIKRHGLERHPAKKDGAITIGCLLCGGGAQFDNSGFKIVRHQDPAMWRRFMLDHKAGEIVLSIKYNRPLEQIREAIIILGGLEKLIDEKPYLFDFLRVTPMKGYEK